MVETDGFLNYSEIYEIDKQTRTPIPELVDMY